MQKFKKQKNTVPKLPLLACIVILGAIITYLFHPMFNEEKTTPVKTTKIKKETKKQTTQQPVQKEQKSSSQQSSLFAKYYNPNKVAPTIKQEEKKTYVNFYSLLDKLKTLPINKKETVSTIVGELLKFKQYPANIINVEFENIPQSAINNTETITIAYFDYEKGIIKVNELALSQITTPELIAVIAHELDHFDTIAKIYKGLDLKSQTSIITDYVQMPNPFNKTFWSKASEYANSTTINLEEYLFELVKYINKEEIHTLSIYPYLNQIATHTNNILEKRAYKTSDDIIDYYKIQKPKESIRLFAEDFEKIDNKITSVLKQYKYLSEEQECIFDYFLIQALIEENPRYKTLYQEITLYNNSDMTPILKKFLEENKELFTIDQKTQNNSFAKITDIIKKIQTKTDATITSDIILKSMEYKINTIKNNIHKESTKEVLKKKILNYIKFAKEINMLTPEIELDYLITLICLENNIYTNNTNSFHSFYSNVPKELYDLYKIENKLQEAQNNASREDKELLAKKEEKLKKFAFYKEIYKNAAFIEEKENNYNEMEDAEILKDLVERNKINIKI